MGWFSKTPDRASLEGRKTVSIHGHAFVIRKVNPIMDFREDNMPQIFAAYASRRRKTEPDQVDSKGIKRIQADVAAMITAGLVSPELSSDPKTGITVADIMRDEEVAAKLYWEILVHSLCKFRGVSGIFFSIKLRLSLSTALRNATAAALAKSYSETESLV